MQTMVQNDYTLDVGYNASQDTLVPAGDGDMKVYAYNSITLTVGTDQLPLSQIKMDQTSITLTVGPIPGLQSIIQMDATGITHTAPGGMTQLMIQPSGITNICPMYTVTATATITLMAPEVTIGAVLTTPSLDCGRRGLSGIPVI